jgi:hypothetical protein
VHRPDELMQMAPIDGAIAALRQRSCRGWKRRTLHSSRQRFRRSASAGRAGRSRSSPGGRRSSVTMAGSYKAGQGRAAPARRPATPATRASWPRPGEGGRTPPWPRVGRSPSAG